MDIQPLKCFFGCHPSDEDAYEVVQELWDQKFNELNQVRAETKYCKCGTAWMRFRAITYYPDANQYGLETPPKFSKWIKWRS